tara:strand:- start:31 stop:375 length:345 start_codon:yes stop_codon:yes gene_type:complete
MEIRGRQYKSVQGTATISNSSDVIIPSVTGKTLYLNYISFTVSDSYAGNTGELTDGDGGTIFWKIEIRNYYFGGRSYMLKYGEYGLALTEGNGLYGSTSNAGYEIVVHALGYFK